jgi:putative SOS response-associated peptidase YedK
MCGRFALALQVSSSRTNPIFFLKSFNDKADEVEQLDGYPALRVDQWVNRDRYVPRYNVAPRTHAPVIRRAQPEEPALVMHSMKWGLVPHWSKSEPPTLNTINARSENLQEGGGMWGSVKGRKRCVVVAQGYVRYPLPVSTTVEGTELKHNPHISSFAGNS